MGAVDQQQMMNELWERIEPLAVGGGARAVIEFAASIGDPEERRRTFWFARQLLSGREWEGKDLSVVAAVAKAGIEEFLNQAETETDEEMSAKLLDTANAFSYNLSADLADCWPGDELQRTNEHFEIGLSAAEHCIEWRKQLNKGPGPFSGAHWAAGMHSLSLGHLNDARKHFAKSLAWAEKGAREEGRPADLVPEAGFGVILGHGYLGLAEAASGSESGSARYQKALDAFEGMKEIEGQADDAQFGIDQLRKVEQKYGKG